MTCGQCSVLLRNFKTSKQWSEERPAKESWHMFHDRAMHGNFTSDVFKRLDVKVAQPQPVLCEVVCSEALVIPLSLGIQPDSLFAVVLAATCMSLWLGQRIFRQTFSLFAMFFDTTYKQWQLNWVQRF